MNLSIDYSEIDDKMDIVYGFDKALKIANYHNYQYLSEFILKEHIDNRTSVNKLSSILGIGYNAIVSILMNIDPKALDIKNRVLSEDLINEIRLVKLMTTQKAVFISRDLKEMFGLNMIPRKVIDIWRGDRCIVGYDRL